MAPALRLASDTTALEVFALAILSVALGLGGAGEAHAASCTSSTRAGTLPSTCQEGWTKMGDRCYQPCDADHFGGNGGYCFRRCPTDFEQDGSYCKKPAAYGRGAGYTIADKGKCERENSDGCEMSGLLYYPKCRARFHAVGCCICSPDCPSGSKDIGVSCEFPKYKPQESAVRCRDGEDLDAGLCYPQCPVASKAAGPLCWSYGCVPSKLIRVKQGVSGDRKYLSVTADGTKVDLFTRDDGSGRQRWHVVDAATKGTVFIIISGGVSGSRKFLQCTGGSGIALGETATAGSQWTITERDGSATITCAILGAPHLSTNHDGTVVDAFQSDDGSGRQRWILSLL